MEINEALEKLEGEHILICVENHVLIGLRNKKIYLWHEKWHSRISKKDFISLFYENTFILYEDEVGIDMEKDDEYYAWRNRYL